MEAPAETQCAQQAETEQGHGARFWNRNHLQTNQWICQIYVRRERVTRRVVGPIDPQQAGAVSIGKIGEGRGWLEPDNGVKTDAILCRRYLKSPKLELSPGRLKKWWWWLKR